VTKACCCLLMDFSAVTHILMDFFSAKRILKEFFAERPLQLRKDVGTHLHAVEC